MDAFNADFYTTVATLIPVLYLALTLQGTTFARLMIYWRTTNKRAAWKFLPQLRVSPSGNYFNHSGFSGLVQCLRRVSNAPRLVRATFNSFDEPFDIFAVVTLLLITVAGPTVNLVVAFVGSMADDFRRVDKKRDEPSGEKTEQVTTDPD